MEPETNVKQAVPIFAVTDMQRSLRFYLDGLGCRMKISWPAGEPVRWCWLAIGDAALMLQTFLTEAGEPKVFQSKPGEGVTISFQCRDALALYHAFRQNGLQPTKPFVGNAMWVTSVSDPDGYRLEFESPTDAPEESEYEG